MQKNYFKHLDREFDPDCELLPAGYVHSKITGLNEEYRKMGRLDDSKSSFSESFGSD